jgi:hypothetical protein
MARYWTAFVKPRGWCTTERAITKTESSVW